MVESPAMEAGPSKLGSRASPVESPSLFSHPNTAPLHTYLAVAPYPVFAVPYSSKTADLRAFDLTTTYFANAEAERATGGRGLWKCLSVDGKAKLSLGIEGAWKRYLGRRRRRSGGMSRLSSSDTVVQQGGPDQGDTKIPPLESPPPVETIDVFQLVYTPSGEGQDLRPEMQHMQWSATFISTPNDSNASASSKVVSESHMLLLTGTTTRALSPTPSMVRPRGDRTSSHGSEGIPEVDDLVRSGGSTGWDTGPPSSAVPTGTSSEGSKTSSPMRVPRQLSDPASAMYHHNRSGAPSLHSGSPSGDWALHPASNTSVDSLQRSINERSSGARTPDSFSSSHSIFGNMSRQWESELDEEDDVAFARILARVAEQAPVGLVRATPSAKIVWDNEQWHKMVGLQPGQNRDLWLEKVHEKHIAHILQVIANQIEQKIPADVEFQWHDGRWTRLTTSVEVDADGEVTALIGAVIDVTERKRLEDDKLRAAKEREMGMKKLAEAAERAKEEAERREQIQRELEQKATQFARMSKASTCGLTSARNDGLLFWANDTFYKMHDLQPTDDPNIWGDRVHPEDLAKLVDQWASARESMQPLKTRHRLTNGKTVMAHSVPIWDEQLQEHIWVGSITEITAQVASEAKVAKLNEEKLEGSRKAAAEAEERRKVAVEQQSHTEYLVDMVSHETRNAISPILQSSLLVKKSLLELHRQLIELQQTVALPAGIRASMDKLEDDFEALDAITDSAHAQERVSNDILGLAQIQLNQLAVNPIPFDLKAIVRSIQRMFTAPCRAAEVELRVDLGKTVAALGPDCQIKADASRIQQVMVNLLSNAVRYGSLGQQVKRVSLQIELAAIGPPEPSTEQLLHPDKEKAARLLSDEDEVYLVVAVSDTGPGMSEQQQTRLFKKFSHTGSASSQTGLGLYIAKKLCEIQGGGIAVTSTPGGGSTFVAHFRVQAVVNEAGNVNEIGRAASAPARAQPMKTKKCLRILAVDDNVINRKILKRQLTQEGHECALAHDGQHALDTIQSNEAAGTRFDCIILDFNMPVLSGIDCVKQIRANEKKQVDKSKRYWVIGCTGQARPEQIKEGTEAGLDRVLTKPYRIKGLLDALSPPLSPDKKSDPIQEDVVISS